MRAGQQHLGVLHVASRVVSGARLCGCVPGGEGGGEEGEEEGEGEGSSDGEVATGRGEGERRTVRAEAAGAGGDGRGVVEHGGPGRTSGGLRRLGTRERNTRRHWRSPSHAPIQTETAVGRREQCSTIAPEDPRAVSHTSRERKVKPTSRRRAQTTDSLTAGGVEETTAVVQLSTSPGEEKRERRRPSDVGFPSGPRRTRASTAREKQLASTLGVPEIARAAGVDEKNDAPCVGTRAPRRDGRPT